MVLRVVMVVAYRIWFVAIIDVIPLDGCVTKLQQASGNATSMLGHRVTRLPGNCQ